jgi:protein tyrosine/serine phosphatase
LTIATRAGDPSANDEQHVGRRETARKILLEGVPNLAEITPNLFRGGQPTKTGLQNLAKLGISIVVDGRGDSSARDRERAEVIRLGIQYVAIPWHCPFPKDSVFVRFLLLIRQNPEKKIFVHCRLGDDRVGMMIAAYRMAEQGWTAEQAMQEMRIDGFTSSHHFICPGLARYEKSFPHHYKTDPAFRPLW